MGYRWDEELRFFVYFCPPCEAEKVGAAKVEVLPKAA